MRLTRVATGILCAVLASAVGADEPLMVEVAVVEARSVPREYSASGEVVARDLSSVSFATGGRVARVLVAEGDNVTKGQELAHLDPVQQRQKLKAADAAVTQAEADAAKARDDYTRIASLFQSGSATQAQLDDALAAQKGTSALAVKARAERDTAEKALNDTILRAPVDGIVTARLAEEGLVIGTGQPAFEIAAGPLLDATFDIAEVVLTRGVDGAPPVTLMPLDGDGASVQGAVREVSPVVDVARGTVTVKVAISGTPPGLLLGAPVRGSVQFEEPAMIRLPGAALLRAASGPAVWVRDPATGAVDLRAVRIAEHETGSVVIAEGLEVGDQVVTRGAHLLFRGRLTVIAAAPEASP